MPQKRRRSVTPNDSGPTFIPWVYPKWMDSSRCGDGTYSPDMWTPEGVSGNETKNWFEPAIKVCLTECPVLDQCRQYAVSEAIKDGNIWGGQVRRHSGNIHHKPNQTAWNRNGTPLWSSG